MVEVNQRDDVLERVIDLFTDKYLDQNYQNYLIDENFPDDLKGKVSFPDFDGETKKDFSHTVHLNFGRTEVNQTSYKLFSCVEFPELQIVINLWIWDTRYFGWGEKGRLELVHKGQSIFDQSLNCETLGRETGKYSIPFRAFEEPGDWWIEPLGDTLNIWDKFKYEE